MFLNILKNHACHPLRTAGRIFLITSVLFALSCSRQARFKALNFFFDGVPSPDAKRASAQADTLDQSQRAGELATDSTATNVPVYSFHPILEQNECATCHDQQQSFRLSDLPEALCLNCHDQAEEVVVHEPVASGMCTECHNPHGSQAPHLLKEVEEDLCFQCHDEQEIKPQTFATLHAPVQAGSCTECHNPHGSANPRMLIAAQEILCFECHAEADFKPAGEDAFTHAPVAEDLCLECHSPHYSESPKLLVTVGQALCFQCHDENDITSLEMHDGIEDMACYECHDPHKGDNEFYLK